MQKAQKTISNEGTFGGRLLRALAEVSFTQAELAEQIGRTQAAVSQWCADDKKPTPANISLIAKTLSISRDWLESGLGPMRLVDRQAQRNDYCEKAYWGFRLAPPDGGRDYGNANIWSFEPTVEVLVREVLQNALDAALPGSPGVHVCFRLIQLRNGDLHDYLETLRWTTLRKHLEASTQKRQKLGDLIKDGLDWLDENDELTLLIIEDSGTTGLLGPETGEGKFAALCRNNLDSNKEGAATKGGAFGLGKAVLWRSSRFATVMFCSNLSQMTADNNRNLRILGRCDLPWHDCDGKEYAGPSWFGQPNSEIPSFATSFWNNEALASDLYLNRTDVGSGTSACVVGFHDPSFDTPKSPRQLATEIEKAAAAHFFPALTAGRLSVSVQTYGNRHEYEEKSPNTVVEVNPRQAQPEFWQILKAFEEGAFAETLNTPGDIVLRSVPLAVPSRKVDPKHGEYDHEALLLVRYAPEDEASSDTDCLAMYRGPGMVVEMRNLRGICLGSRPFHALLLCGTAAGEKLADQAADEFLRTAEPPSHNRWLHTAELKTSYARGCLKKLDSFLASAVDILRNLVKPGARDLGDGPNSLRELFQIGPEPISTARERPRVVSQRGEVDADGRWHVEARVRLKSADRPMLITPAVLFVAETGAGQAVAWQEDSLESITGCTVQDGELRVPPRTRELAFRGITDPESHPVPASVSSIVVDLRRIVALPKDGEQ